MDTLYNLYVCTQYNVAVQSNIGFIILNRQ